MSVTRHRAWRFLHPDIDAADEFAGLGITASGGIEMVEENASVRQAILILLTTATGERVMRPEYGCDLHTLIFSPNDDTTAGLAMHFVRRALARWEPRIQVLHLDAGVDPVDTTRLDIVLEYRVRATRHTDQVSVSMNLAGEQT
jgi:phage baseplate assembly protein W